MLFHSFAYISASSSLIFCVDKFKFIHIKIFILTFNNALSLQGIQNDNPHHTLPGSMHDGCLFQPHLKFHDTSLMATDYIFFALGKLSYASNHHGTWRMIKNQFTTPIFAIFTDKVSLSPFPYIQQIIQAFSLVTS